MLSLINDNSDGIIFLNSALSEKLVGANFGANQGCSNGLCTGGTNYNCTNTSCDGDIYNYVCHNL